MCDAAKCVAQKPLAVGISAIPLLFFSLLTRKKPKKNLAASPRAYLKSASRGVRNKPEKKKGFAPGFAQPARLFLELIFHARLEQKGEFRHGHERAPG